MYNRVVLIGRIGRDTEPRYMPDGERGVLNFSIATNRRWQDKDGNWKDSTQWHNIVYWPRNARQVSERLKKGVLVMVEGEIRYRQWEDKDGATHDRTEIYANRVLSLERREREAAAAEPEGATESEIPPAREGGEGAPAGAGTEDDLPF